MTIRHASIAQESFVRSLATTALGSGADAHMARLAADGIFRDARLTSREIDRLKPLAAAAKAAKVNADLDLGMYRSPEGTIYRVVKSRESGRLYAKRLIVLKANSAEFTYDGGAIYKIKPEWRMTLEQAKAFGLQWGICCVCAANLSDPKSVAAGIGPICGKRV